MHTNQKEIWIFLSHSNKDYEKVRQVRNMLEEQNLRPLMFFLHCLNDDDEIDELIKREIDCRTRFILCDSENAQSSKWVQKEVDYIKSQDRLYETIDLSKSIEDIQKQLQQFINRTRLFFSYNREECSFAKQVAERLSKYDFSVFMDMLWDFSQKYRQDYVKDTLTNLDESARDGYVVAFVNDRVLSPNCCSRNELLRAISRSNDYKTTPNVIVFAVNSTVAKKIETDSELSSICKDDVFSLENILKDDKSDFVTEVILRKLMIPGSILSQANNLKNGINCKKDEEEAEWLYKLCFKIAQEQERHGSPSGNVGLAKCYEFGYGTEINLPLAKEYYQEAMLHEFPMCKEDYLRVCDKIENQMMTYSNESGTFICKRKPHTNEIVLVEFIPNTENLINKNDTRIRIKQLHIPNEIQHFADEIFRWIEVTNEIVLLDGLLSIGDDTEVGTIGCIFANSILPEVVIPESVRSIGDFAFGKATIKRLELSGGITSRYGRQFKNAHIETLRVPKVDWEDKTSWNPFSDNNWGYKRRFFMETQIDNLELY